MRVMRITGLFTALLLLAACVTINIYFPAAQAEQAAEEMIQDILGKKDQQTAPPADDKGALLPTRTDRSFASIALDFLIPSAHAASPDFNVDTPEIRALQASMKKRHSSLAPYYANGAIGYTQDALVGIHDASVIPLKERARVQKLVAGENSDRDALYRAIANANGYPEWEADVRATFAKKWVQEAGAGWWYQDENGAWKQK